MKRRTLAAFAAAALLGTGTAAWADADHPGHERHGANHSHGAKPQAAQPQAGREAHHPHGMEQMSQRMTEMHARMQQRHGQGGHGQRSQENEHRH